MRRRRPADALALRDTLREVTWEAIFVDDGSTDETLTIIERAALDDGRIKLLRFSRNFGHQAAVTAGLDFADGDAVVVMDADLQDPPELLPHMLALFEQGYDVVSPQRISREAETRFKRWTAMLFYRVCREWPTSPSSPMLATSACLAEEPYWRSAPSANNTAICAALSPGSG